MAEQPQPRRVSLRESLELHDRHEQLITELGSRWNDSLPAAVRRTLLRMAHQKQRLLIRAGLR